MKIRDRFVEAIKAEQRVFSVDRSKSLGASETFACIRKGWFAKHKPELGDPTKNWGVLERGTVIENSYAVPKLRHIFGKDNCLYMGGDQETFVLQQSSATPDGLVLNQPLDTFADDGLASTEVPEFMCEIKSFDPRMNLKDEKDIHRGQTIMQLGQVRHHTKYKPVYSALLYINASDWTDIRPFFIKFNEAAYQQGRERAAKIYATTDVTKLFPEGKHTDQCRYCQFAKHCNAADIRVFPSHISNYGDNEVKLMHGLALDYNKAAEQVKEAKKAAGIAADTIKATLVEMKSKGMESDDFKVTYSKMAGKESLDREALESFLVKNGATYDDFVKLGEDFTRLTVTIR